MGHRVKVNQVGKSLYDGGTRQQKNLADIPNLGGLTGSMQEELLRLMHTLFEVVQMQ